jgi:hypothetical protein
MKRRRDEDAEVTTASATVLEAQQQKKRQRSEVEETHRPTADAKLDMHSKVPLGMSADAVSSGGTLTTWRLAESRHKGWGLRSIFSQLDLC